MLKRHRMDVLAGRCTTHVAGSSGRVIIDVLVAVDALDALHLELVRDVTLEALTQGGSM